MIILLRWIQAIQASCGLVVLICGVLVMAAPRFNLQARGGPLALTSFMLTIMPLCSVQLIPLTPHCIHMN